MLEKEMRALPCLQLHVYRPHDNIALFTCVHLENKIMYFYSDHIFTVDLFCDWFYIHVILCYILTCVFIHL